MSVIRLVTQILPRSFDHAPVPPPVQGTAILKENCGTWPEVQAETTVFRCEGGIENDSWEGLTELRKSRLRLSTSEEPPTSLVHVRPAPGGVLLSVPLRIARGDLLPKIKGFAPKFRCKVCGKGYKTRKPFETHCKEHKTRAFSYTCGLCGQGFHDSALFSAHCKQHESPQMVAQTFQCNSQAAGELS